MIDGSGEHRDWLDSAAAFLLGALADDERDQFQRHLAGCRRCQEMVDGLGPTVDVLTLAVPVAVPSADLRRRVMHAIGVADQPQPTPRRRLPGPLLARPRLASAFAGLLVVVGLAIGFGIGASTSGGPTAAASRSVAARVDQSRAPGAQAALAIQDGQITLIAHHLPPPPPGRIYEVWLALPGRAPAPTSTLFSVRSDGSADVGVPATARHGLQVLVTDERAGGSNVPTRQPIIVSQPT